MIGNKYWTMALKMPLYHDLLEKFGFPDRAIENSKVCSKADGLFRSDGQVR